MEPFQKCFARLSEIIDLERDAYRAVQATRYINDWLAAGIDPDLDIIPAINKVRAHTSQVITSPGYFDKAIKRAHGERIGSSEAKAETARLRAQGFAWKRARDLFLTSQELAELSHYEQQHGTIEVKPRGGS